jgi:hypothetical protein
MGHVLSASSGFVDQNRRGKVRYHKARRAMPLTRSVDNPGFANTLMSRHRQAQEIPAKLGQTRAPNGHWRP